MKRYAISSVEKFIQAYLEKGGELIQIEEGSLGLGDFILVGEGLKTYVSKEVYLSAWSSGQTLRGYNKTPKKYEKHLH